MTDQINPPHYRGFSNGAEVIDIVENLNFNRGNAVKYLSRAGRKSADELTDLRKAKWYVEREIARLKKENDEAVEHGVGVGGDPAVGLPERYQVPGRTDNGAGPSIPA